MVQLLKTLMDDASKKKVPTLDEIATWADGINLPDIGLDLLLVAGGYVEEVGLDTTHPILRRRNQEMMHGAVEAVTSNSPNPLTLLGIYGLGGAMAIREKINELLKKRNR